MSTYRHPLLFILLLSVSSLADAQQVPFQGCFVQENNQCADVEIQCSTDSSENYTAFDVAVGRLCDEILSRNAAITDMQEIINETSRSIARIERAHTILARRSAALQRQKARADQRIFRLFRACGPACRGL